MGVKQRVDMSEFTIDPKRSQLTIICEVPRAGRNTKYDRFFLCRCTCGKTKEVRMKLLRSYETLSCGCRAHTQPNNGKRTHGMSKGPLYSTWYSMMRRCLDETNKDFKQYGGRGVSVCSRWRTFTKFYSDMSKTWEEGLTLDRKDVNGDYEPNNCRWATVLQQNRNKTSTRRLTAFGETKALTAWAEDPRCRVSARLLMQRFDRGWNHATAITKPSQPKLRK
jgi:hypothetical protein